MLANWMKITCFMKPSFVLALLVALSACPLAVNAGDTPPQAAARAALEQMMSDLDHPQIQVPPGTPSATATVQSDRHATNASARVSPTGAAPQTSPATSGPAAAPVAATATALVPAMSAQPAAAPTEAPSAASVATPTPKLAVAQPKSSGPAAKVNPTNELVTTDGTIYENVQVEKVQPDGIVISYTLPTGGVAMSKVFYSQLSPQSRQQFGRKSTPLLPPTVLEAKPLPKP